MKVLIVVACFVAIAYAKPSGWHGHHGVLVGASGAVSGHGTAGPVGAVTGHGAIGPNGEHSAIGGGWGGGWDDGHWGGGWDDGHWDGDDGGAWGWGGHANVVHGNGATLVGPGVGHAHIVGPHGHHGHW